MTSSVSNKIFVSQKVPNEKTTEINKSPCIELFNQFATLSGHCSANVQISQDWQYSQNEQQEAKKDNKNNIHPKMSKLYREMQSLNCEYSEMRKYEPGVAKPWIQPAIWGVNNFERKFNKEFPNEKINFDQL